MSFVVVINNEKIEFLDHIKILGVFFSSDMSWNAHIEFLQIKLSKDIGLLTKGKATFPIRIKLTIYNSLVCFHLNYFNLAWGTTTETNLTKLYLVQKRAVRAIACVQFLHPTESLFRPFI